MQLNIIGHIYLTVSGKKKNKKVKQSAGEQFNFYLSRKKVEKSSGTYIATAMGASPGIGKIITS